MKILGIDWGKRSVGLAVSEGILASPLRSLSISSLKDGVQQVQKVIKEEGIEQLVIGIPESGEAKKMAESAYLEFKKLDLDIVASDETLSTQKAGEYMKNYNIKGDDHKMAAALILQEYLDYARA